MTRSIQMHAPAPCCERVKSRSCPVHLKPPAKSPRNHVRCFVIFGCFVPLRALLRQTKSTTLATCPSIAPPIDPDAPVCFSRGKPRPSGSNEPATHLTMRRVRDLECEPRETASARKNRHSVNGCASISIRAFWRRHHRKRRNVTSVRRCCDQLLESTRQLTLFCHAQPPPRMRARIFSRAVVSERNQSRVLCYDSNCLSRV